MVAQGAWSPKTVVPARGSEQGRRARRRRPRAALRKPSCVSQRKSFSLRRFCAGTWGACDPTRRFPARAADVEYLFVLDAVRTGTAAGLAPLVSAYKVQGGTLQGHCPPLTAPSPFRATDSGAPAGCRLCCQLLEPRHLVHLVNRFENNRTDSVHTAFINRIGYESWENIWVGTSCYSASRGRTSGYVVVVLWSLWLHCSVFAFIS